MLAREDLGKEMDIVETLGKNAIILDFEEKWIVYFKNVGFSELIAMINRIQHKRR